MIPLYDDNPTHRFPLITIALIAVNVLVYFGWQMRVGLEQSVEIAAFVPADLTAHVPGAVTSMIAAMFMHGGFMHLLGNMWFLWIFGDNVENETGYFRFIAFYILTGVAATLGHTWAEPRSTVPLVGASGAISGVLGAYLVRHPNVAIRTLIPLGIFTRIVDVPAWVFLFVWIGLQFLNEFTGAPGGVAYLAHIAGFAAGVVLIFLFGKNQQELARERRR